MSERDALGNDRLAKPGANRRRLTQVESIRRQQEIVRLREVERRTFREIAEAVGMGENETREAFRRYVNDVAPLLAVPAADEQIVEHLRALDEIRQSLWRVAPASKGATPLVSGCLVAV
jgi:hypothetical protein